MGDVRFAITDNELAIKYQEANDLLDSALEISIDSLSEESNNETAHNDSSSQPEELSTTHNLSTGDKIGVHWPLDDTYYPGSISEYYEGTGKHKVAYDDGQIETLNMKNETSRIQNANQVSIPNLAFIYKHALETYFRTFAHKEFMLHQA